MSAGVASVNFLCTFIGLYLVERIGRRKLLLGSMLGVCISLGFLAIGFQMADTNTPIVSVIENNDYCSNYTNCGDCTFDTNCGYCFIQPDSNSNDLAQNASCVQINTEDPDFAKYGRCSKNSTLDSLTF